MTPDIYGQIYFEVTQEDIDNGRGSPEFCPVARAIDRAIDHKLMVLTYSHFTYLEGEPYLVYKNSYETVAWIHEFDSHRPVKPFSGQVDFLYKDATGWQYKG